MDCDVRHVTSYVTSYLDTEKKSLKAFATLKNFYYFCANNIPHQAYPHPKHGLCIL